MQRAQSYELDPGGPERPVEQRLVGGLWGIFRHRGTCTTFSTNRLPGCTSTNVARVSASSPCNGLAGGVLTASANPDAPKRDLGTADTDLPPPFAVSCRAALPGSVSNGGGKRHPRREPHRHRTPADDRMSPMPDFPERPARRFPKIGYSNSITARSDQRSNPACMIRIPAPPGTTVPSTTGWRAPVTPGTWLRCPNGMSCRACGANAVASNALLPTRSRRTSTPAPARTPREGVHDGAVVDPTPTDDHLIDLTRRSTADRNRSPQPSKPRTPADPQGQLRLVLPGNQRLNKRGTKFFSRSTSRRRTRKGCAMSSPEQAPIDHPSPRQSPPTS